MRRLARLSAVGIVGFGLGFAATGLAELGSASVVNASNKRPTQRGGTLAPAPPNGDVPTTQAAPSRASDPKSAADADAQKSGGGGYSWSEKKRGGHVKAKAPARLDPSRPLAQAPNFELRSNGSSVVTLLLSRPTSVTRTVKGRRVEYRLKGVQIGVENNTNPLVTAHFATPLERVVLRRTKRDATLQLDLRESVEPSHLLRSGPEGASVLEVTLPRPTRVYSTPSSHAPAKSDASDPQVDASPKRERQKPNRSPAQAGPGPRL